jgi:uncharacterized protein (TIGR00730 family)
MIFRRLKEYKRFLKSWIKINYSLLSGSWSITKAPKPAITIFGSSKISVEAEISQKAQQLAKKLTIGGFSIFTGGGPGIMEASNKGAYEAAEETNKNVEKRTSPLPSSVGIGVTRLNEGGINKYVHEYIEMDHFFTRKWFLIRYASAFIVFPGGFGTLDELFEIITLMQTKRIPKLPIVLVGKDFWEYMIKFIDKSLLAGDFIESGDEKTISLVTDDVDEAYDCVFQHCKATKNH